VPAESVISADFEPYNDERELRRLIRAVQFSKKHDLIADVKKNLKGKPVKVVRFKKPVADLLGELQKKVIGENCEAVFVQGLEYSISSDGEGDENALIHNLNISRDAFKKYLSCPLFLWLPEYALVKITRHAPDFFSVRSGTFYFSNPPEKVTEQIFQSVSSNWTITSSLSLAEKLKKIETLENLLAEYRGLHREKQDKRAELRLLSGLAIFFHSVSEYRKAIEYHEQSLEISREISDRQGEGVSLGNLGNAYNRLGEYRKAIEYHEQHLEISREIGDRQGEGNSLGSLGNAYDRLGEYRKAIEYHEQHLEISREISNRQGEGASLGNLGNAYHRLGEYRKAIEYHEQHLEISREIGNRQGEGNSLGNLGNAYDRLGEYRKAIEYYEQSLEISREIGDRQGEGASLNNLGLTYDSLGETEKACVLWNEAMAILESIESPNAGVMRRLIEGNCQS
jgi:tetratricopeptide (TPR) repeat protein